jgi:hypothetical protein
MTLWLPSHPFSPYRKADCTFNDILIEDDGRRKDIQFYPLNAKPFQKPSRRELTSQAANFHLAKFMFYAEHFSIMQLIGRTGEVVGFTRISLHRCSGWAGVSPDRPVPGPMADAGGKYLSWTKMNLAGSRAGLIDPPGENSLPDPERLLGEAEAGIFPSRYIG